MAAARAQLDQATFDRALSEGRALTLEHINHARFDET
jgi:hypothetical protein